FGLRESRAAVTGTAGAMRAQSVKDALQEAFQTQGFWLLTIGFFVCGFHVAFIGLHLPSYISDHAVSLSSFGHPVSTVELGGWGAGRLYDIQGNYDVMWWIAVGLGVFAAIIHWFIRERPVARLVPAVATA